MGVINEALRLYPPAIATSRLVGPKGITLPGCGMHLPEGTVVFGPSYAFHHDPDYWPRVEEFLPERWTEVSWASCAGHSSAASGHAFCGWHAFGASGVSTACL